jgi:hypothetical protein
MPRTDDDRKDPSNEEIVDYLQRGLVMRMRECPVLKRKVGKKLTTFELRTNFLGADYRFEGMWLDGTGTKVLAGATNKEYCRANALASLLDDKCFAGVEAWAVACRNALGDNVDNISLAGSIFVDGQCVDDLLVVASAAEDKTDDKQPASPVHKTDDKVDDLAVQVKRLHDKTNILAEIVQELGHQFLMTNASPPTASHGD